MKTMKDYHNLYLKCDILFLADTFEKFMIALRSMDYVWIIIWVHQMTKGTGGGIPYVSNRYSKANNKHLKILSPKTRIKTYT